MACFLGFPRKLKETPQGRAPVQASPAQGRQPGCLRADDPLPFLITGTAGQVRGAVVSCPHIFCALQVAV